MKNLKTVINFTMKEMVKRKSFIISSLIIIAIIVIGMNVPNILKAFTGDNTGEKLLLIDSQNIFEGNLEVLKDTKEYGYEFDITNKDVTFEDIKNKIENEEISEAIIIEKDKEEIINVRYIVKDATMLYSVPEQLISTINSIYNNMQIAKLELTNEQLQTLVPNFEYSLEQTQDQEVRW